MKYFYSCLILLFAQFFLLACTGQDKVSIEQSVEPNSLNAATNTTDDTIVLSISTNGGCIRMGPNCPRYELMRDASFKVYRGEDTKISANGKIERALVDKWVKSVNTTNFAELRVRLGKGECKACYDGIDFTYTVFKNDIAVVFNSQENDFSQKETFFTLSEKIHRAMQDKAPLELKSRH